MSDTEVLVLNGSPGSGKSTLADEISENLRNKEIQHAVIDIDELSRTHPEPEQPIKWKNLGLIWPSYTTVPELKVILPVLIDSAKDLLALKNATPCARFIICELVADDSVLEDRITVREPNDFWQGKLRNLVSNYSKRDSKSKFGDFQMRTDDKSIGATALEIINRLDWVSGQGT